MLANLSSLIWGSADTPVTAATITTTTTTSTDAIITKDVYKDTLEGSTEFNIEATTPEDDDESDWVLVDRSEVDEASHDEVESIVSATAVAPSALTPTITPKRATSTLVVITHGAEWSDVGPQDWLVTPPPCFIRSQAAPLVSSALENLLIEHPSMSVYLPRPRPNYANAAAARIFPQRVAAHPTPSPCSPSSASPSSQPALVEREDSPMKENTAEESENQVAEAPPARGGVVHRASNVLQAIDVLRPAQKAQRRRDERRLKHKCLDRSNKVREVAAAGNKRAKRRDLMGPGKFSRAVNNRKC